MHVLVITRSTPDKEAKISVNAAGEVTYSGDLTINPWDEYTVTEAVLLKEAYNVKTTILAIGDETQNDTLKKGLAIGIDQAIRVWDASLTALDSLGYADVVAATVRKLGDVSLILFGKEFMDLGTDAHVFQVGRKLGLPVIGSYLKIINAAFDQKQITVERFLEEGKQTVTSQLPTVLQVFQDINEARYPSFMGIRKAAKAAIPVWTSADLGITAPAPKTVTTAYQNLPAKVGNVELFSGASESEAAQKLVAKLVEVKAL